MSRGRSISEGRSVWVIQAAKSAAGSNPRHLLDLDSALRHWQHTAQRGVAPCSPHCVAGNSARSYCSRSRRCSPSPLRGTVQGAGCALTLRRCAGGLSWSLLESGSRLNLTLDLHVIVQEGGERESHGPSTTRERRQTRHSSAQCHTAARPPDHSPCCLAAAQC